MLVPRVSKRAQGCVAFLVLSLTMVSGCVTPTDQGDGDSGPATPAAILVAFDQALVSGGEHRHDDPHQHNGTGWDLRATFQGHLPLGLDWPVERQALGQLQVIDDYAFVALTLAGFAILDVSDPASPQFVGVFDAGRSLLNDVEVTPDLRWAFVPSDRVVPPPPDPADFDPASQVPYPPPGIVIVDLSDLSAPREAGIYVSPESFGYHRLDLFEIDGSTYVFAATYSRATQHPAGCRMDILRFDEGPVVPTLTKVGSYASTVPAHAMLCTDLEAGSGGAHDIFVTADPLDGFPLAVVSMWDAGVHLLDVSNPTVPRLLGYWDEMPWYNGEQTPENLVTGNAHEAQVTAVDGRRIVVVSMERAWASAQGITWLVDFTDPAAAELVSQWQIPGLHAHRDHDSDAYTMTTHGPKIYDGRIWLAHHHAGLIVLNITTMDQVLAPEIEAWLLPPPVAEPVWFGIWLASPMVYDVVVRDRDVFITDITSGFRIAQWAPGTGLWTESATGT